MATIKQFKINGVIDTSKNVLENLNDLANVSGCYLTWDPSQGKWIVILNAATTSVKNFNDSNIIGEINVGGTGVNELYNSVIATFPNKDTRDTVDVVQLTVPSADRFQQELDNVLNLSIPIVNEPVQAAYIASRELKQSRLDKLIEFRANFEANTVRAGDVIDITNSALDYNGKLFRVIQIDEEDEEDGNLIFSITAQEYDANVYDPNSGINGGLTYEYRSNFTGIKSKILSQELATKDDISAGKQIGGLLAANAALGLINSLFSVDEETGAIINEGKFSNPDIQNAIASISAPALEVNSSTSVACSGSSFTISYGHDCESCFFDNPQFDYSYTITGVTENEVDIPLTGTITTTGSSTSGFFITATVTEEKQLTFSTANTSTVVTIKPTPDAYVQNVESVPESITEGESIAVTITTVGYSNGTTLPYLISGTASSKVSSPSLTGTITINNNSATLNISTQDDGVYDTDKSLTIAIDGGIDNPCVIGTSSLIVVVRNDDVTGPPPPAYGTVLSSVCDGTTLVETVANGNGGSFERRTENSTQCGYVAPIVRSYALTPIVWNGTYDSSTGNLLSVNVLRYAYMPLPFAGEPTAEVPLTLSVTSGSSSTITVDTTRTISTVSTLGGTLLEPITTFDAVGSLSAITGVRAAIWGYY